MSASNWITCPRCLIEAKKKKKNLQLETDKKYGKIPACNYLELLKESKKPLESNESLREDYEFHLTGEGLFSAVYKCRCETCGFGHFFKHKEQLSIAVKAQ